MSKRLYTEACIRGMQPGSTLLLGREAMATPAALDLAFQRGIPVRYGDPSAQAPTRGASAGSPWPSMLASDGTYVVEVRAGVPRVYRLTQEGPILMEVPGASP